MTDINKIYTPEVIKDTDFPASESASLTTSGQVAGDTYQPDTITEQPFPISVVANELINNVINTRSQKILGKFRFTPSGAIQVGQYKSGVSGDIKISPDGIVALNKSGDNTFILDGESGDAAFSGTIFAGNLITGQVDVGTGAGGAYVRLDGANNRMVVHDGITPRIVIGNVT